MSKVLVTHINPHIDDIAAIWLFKKFYRDFKDAQIEFISASKSDEVAGSETEDKVFFGVGKGRFDEHKGDKEECATSLVWKEIKEKGLAPKDEIICRAFETISEWNRKVDTGQTNLEFDAFAIPAYLRPKDDTPESSLKAVELGEQILDRVLEVLRRNINAEDDWDKRLEFETKYGKSFAVSSHFVNRAFCKDKGGDLFLMVDPKYNSLQYFTPGDHDLEELFNALKGADPDASWYFHHSHHFIICGSSGAAPDAKPTKLTFEQLIEIAKNLK